MKVDKLLHDYRIADKVRDGGFNFIKEHVTKSYVPYMEKMARCELLVNSCWYRIDPDTGVKRLAVNSPNLHVMFTMELVNQYTDIELDYEGTKIVENYDDLRKSGVLNVILGLIPASEREQFKAVLEMTKSDLMTNEYEVGAYVKNRISDISTIFGSLIMPALENMGVNKETIVELLSSIQNSAMNK